MKQISPELRRLWEEFRRGDSHTQKFFRAYKDQRGEQPMPINWFPRTWGFQRWKESLPDFQWTEHRTNGKKHTTFEQDGFQVSVTCELEQYTDLELFGTFARTPRETSQALRHNWDQRNTAPDPKPCRGSSVRHRWQYGVYSRKHTHYQERHQYEFGAVDYDYHDLRLSYWKAGYSKAEADLLARRAFQEAVKLLERVGSGQECPYCVTVHVRLAPDTYVLGEESLSSIQYDTEKELNAIIRDLTEAACATARQTLVERRKELADLLTTYDKKLSEAASTTP